MSENGTLSRDLLEPDEVASLIEACGDWDAGVRNAALIALMAGTGIRISEALAVEVRDLDLKKRRLHVRKAKGGKERHVWIHPDALPPLRVWQKVRKGLELTAAPVFCSLVGDPLSASYIRRELPKIAKAAGIEKRVHSHGLRHAFACKAHRSNVSLRSLQLQFGHDSVSATSKYLERIGLHEVFGEFDKAFG